MRKIMWETQFLEQPQQPIDEEDNELFEESDPETDEDSDFGKQINVKKLMATPFGLFSIDDKFNPYYQYKFYVGHTNFLITEEVANIIEFSPGVEVFRVISPYRFILAVGKAFDQAEVRKKITNTFCEDSSQVDDILDVLSTLDDEIYKDYILSLVADLDEIYKKWALVTKSEPEFDCEIIGLKDGDNEQEYQTDLIKFKETYKDFGLYFEKS